MGIRETLNQNPAITTGVTAGIIVIALIVIGWQLFGGGGPRIPTKAYYTVDDGQNWFVDDIQKVPPFDHNGQQAVRVQLFTCDGGKNVFPVYIERYNAQGQAAAERSRQAEATGEPDYDAYEQMEAGKEVKLPRDPNAPWVLVRNHERSGPIMSPQCPDGDNQNLDPVFP